MNKVYIFLTVAVMIAVLGCGGAGSKTNANGVMTMTTSAEKVNIGLQGSGTATIDWGDGSKPETAELENDKQTRISREFSEATPRTITITGENITHLSCRENGLTELDVSRNTALTQL